ncbi:hypothetical protein [Sphingobacterium lactis]|uniref:Uncharacterized protein n=1 Tax=Sphingobacterium lactis TaxID=797291 RepID=A0A1H6BEA7_9SPHI|nr:hypothetical protein [Sphingobacterium lactis]SEG58655.1 hypothetical protein SAMN05421877_11032 [Sphingobacterium lactis]
MNELFFSSLIIGGLFFGNPFQGDANLANEQKRIEMDRLHYHGELALSSCNDKNKMHFKVTGDQVEKGLTLFVDGQQMQTGITAGTEFDIDKSLLEGKEAKVCNITLKHDANGHWENYAQYAISF